jgi:hypothetical protein
MNASAKEQKDRVWQLMEAEKKRDRILQRIGLAAWILTLAALLFTALGIATNVWWAVQAFQAGQVGVSIIFREAMPLVWAVGGVSLLVAVLATVGMFLRLRAASLDEIRVRLAALEGMIDGKAWADQE